jgi:hypothetical protein
MNTATAAAPATAPEKAKPAPPAMPLQLQLNNSGSWKTVARFDGLDPVAYDHAMEAVATLTQINSNYTWRIVTDAAHPVVLTHWDSERGWRVA